MVSDRRRDGDRCLSGHFSTGAAAWRVTNSGCSGFLSASLWPAPHTSCCGREPSHYLAHVLRLAAGAPVLVFNGRDGEWQARIAEVGKKGVSLLIESQTRAQTPAGRLTYAFAPLKHARLDYMVQKAVEMGAGTLWPVTTQHTQADAAQS